MYGMTGAHRTGKTTLAKALAEYKDLPLLPSSTAAVGKELGFDTGKPMIFSERIRYQELVLEHFLKEAKKCPKGFVSDRTPIDFAAYLMADIGFYTGSPDEQERAVAYVRKCIEATQNYFFLIVKHGITFEYVTEEGKPPHNVAFQEHINLLIEGLITDYDGPIIWFNDAKSTEDRLNYIIESEMDIVDQITHDDGRPAHYEDATPDYEH